MVKGRRREGERGGREGGRGGERRKREGGVREGDRRREGERGRADVDLLGLITGSDGRSRVSSELSGEESCTKS